MKQWLGYVVAGGFGGGALFWMMIAAIDEIRFRRVHRELSAGARPLENPEA